MVSCRYPGLKVQGLNAPIPEGAQFGYQPGCWGKPPVDEFGRPLYGDVFGALRAPPSSGARREPFRPIRLVFLAKALK